MTTCQNRPGPPRARISGQLHGGTLDDVGGRIVGGALAPGRGAHPRPALPRVRRVGVRRPRGGAGARVDGHGHARAAGSASRCCDRAHWNVFDPRLIRWRLASRRPRRPAAVTERAAPRLRAGGRLPRRRARRPPSSAAPSPRAVSDMVVHGHSGDLEAYLVADVTFHRTLLEASGNEMFGALGDVVAEVLAGRTHHGLMPDRPNPEAIALHDTVARAVRTGTRRRPSAPCASSSRRPPRRCQSGARRLIRRARPYENWHDCAPTLQRRDQCQFHDGPVVKPAASVPVSGRGRARGRRPRAPPPRACPRSASRSSAACRRSRWR